MCLNQVQEDHHLVDLHHILATSRAVIEWHKNYLFASFVFYTQEIFHNFDTNIILPLMRVAMAVDLQDLPLVALALVVGDPAWVRTVP